LVPDTSIGRAVIRLSLRRLGDNGELVLLQLLGVDEPAKGQRKKRSRKKTAVAAKAEEPTVAKEEAEVEETVEAEEVAEAEDAAQGEDSDEQTGKEL